MGEGAIAGIEELFRAHWPLVYGYLARRTGDPVLAEELAQETFYRATKALLGWRGGAAAGWLLAIARNALVDHVRRGRPLVPLPETLADRSPRFEVDAEVRAALDALPSSQRRLLELVYIDGFSHAEIAAMSRSTPGAIKTAVWRAREALKATYEGGDRDD